MSKIDGKDEKKGKSTSWLSKAGRAILEILEERPRKAGEYTAYFNSQHKYSKRRHSNDMGGLWEGK